MPGIARRAQRAVGALLIGRADQETDPLARILPRDEARNRRLDLVGHVGIGAFGLDVARPRLEVERLARVVDDDAADAAFVEPRLGRLIPLAAADEARKSGRASCSDRGCQYV